MADPLTPLTLAELERLGADPETTTFATWHGPVTHLDGDYEISRENGVVVVTFLCETTEDGWESLDEAVADAQ